MFPVGFVLQFDTKVLRYESIKKNIINIYLLNSLILRLVICHPWYRYRGITFGYRIEAKSMVSSHPVMKRQCR